MKATFKLRKRAHLVITKTRRLSFDFLSLLAGWSHMYMKKGLWWNTLPRVLRSGKYRNERNKRLSLWPPCTQNTLNTLAASKRFRRAAQLCSNYKRFLGGNTEVFPMENFRALSLKSILSASPGWNSAGKTSTWLLVYAGLSKKENCGEMSSI